MFIRVRGASPGDPKHEFDVTVAEARARPHLYAVVDKTPSPVSRPPTFKTGTVRAKRRPKNDAVERREGDEA